MEKKSDVMENFPQNVKSVRIGSRIYTKKNEHVFYCSEATYGLRSISSYDIERMIELDAAVIEELEQTAEENVNETLSTLFGKDLAMEPVKASEELRVCENAAKKATNEAEKAINDFVDSISESKGGPGEVGPIMPESKNDNDILDNVASIVYKDREYYRDSENKEFVFTEVYEVLGNKYKETESISFAMVKDLLHSDEAEIASRYRLDQIKEESVTSNQTESELDITKVDVVESKNGKLFFRKDFLFVNPFTNKVYQEEDIEKFIKLGTMEVVNKGEQDERICKIVDTEIGKLEDVISALNILSGYATKLYGEFYIKLPQNSKLRNMLSNLDKFINYGREEIKDELHILNRTYQKYSR